MLENIRIVLVNTTHPGNIGGVARAMKNMGLSDLCLIEPRRFPHADASARAAGADDILTNATVVESLEDALADCHLVVGTSARSRTIPWPLVNPRELAAIVTPLPSTTRVAIVFGREDRGLTNEELQRCHQHVHIPVNEQFSSLNLAAAVQVITYEMRMAQECDVSDAKPRWGTEWDVDLADGRELERLFDHFEEALTEIDFLDPDKPRNLMPRLQRLLLRAVPDKIEVNILRGMLTAIQKGCRR
ncbi:RNA methyltransferase [Amphritea opalescens]|uniref:tRNA (cytidine/uridine-2'-O-)-methyltransferase TrmJ n=1 Tax=Amphritea opalescens TaxID=2490544 RepID=A0A430KSU0_9GAMM|nr:RNA methyltransferase [Amphritea opalescens]RTE66540.1 RNA methyltransferase [Amphritea opalescens]